MEKKSETKEKVQSWPKSSSVMMRVGFFLLSIYVLVSVCIPLLNWIFPTAIKQLVFMNKINWLGDLSHPEAYGLDRVHHFNLNVEPNVHLGVWHFRSPLIEDKSVVDDQSYFREYLTSSPSNIPILIYFHGNALDRSLLHRRELCQRLRDELKYDVISFDYRAFGDSTGEATELNLNKDARFIYQWLEKLTNHQRKIYLWGHSLGSGVACHLAAQLTKEKSQTLAGLIMEAPFIDLHQALLTHWLSLFFRWQPWYSSMIENGLKRNKLVFSNREKIGQVNCPTVLIHADDDFTVPYIHSKQLLQAAIAFRDHHRTQKTFPHFQIDMISYHRSGYGHRLIYQAPKLIAALKRLIFETI